MAKIDFAINSEGQRVSIHSEKLNRHGFIAGATGTGKTVSLKVLAERFSALSIPVFLSDFKGDLSGLFTAGEIIFPRVAANPQKSPKQFDSPNAKKNARRIPW